MTMSSTMCFTEGIILVLQCRQFLEFLELHPTTVILNMLLEQLNVFAVQNCLVSILMSCCAELLWLDCYLMWVKFQVLIPLCVLEVSPMSYNDSISFLPCVQRCLL